MRFSLFILSPVITLLISAMMQIEQKANSWKYLYATPTKRITVYFSKLITMLTVVSLTTLLLLFFIVISGYLVDFFYFSVGPGCVLKAKKRQLGPNWGPKMEPKSHQSRCQKLMRLGLPVLTYFSGFGEGK